MCFTVHLQFKQPIIASEDILVFKISYPLYFFKSNINEFKSYFYYDFTYKRDKVNGPIPLFAFGGEIERGFHAYISYEKAISRLEESIAIGLFVIPKDSVYYYNPITRETVSNQLKYVGLYNPKTLKKFSNLKQL